MWTCFGIVTLMILVVTPTVFAQEPISEPEQRILFYSDRDGPVLRLYSMRPDGTDVQEIVRHPDERPTPFSGYGADISYDGRMLAFVRGYCTGDTHDTCGTHIHVMDMETGETRVLTDGRHDHNPVWSPDGRHIAYYTRLGFPYAAVVEVSTGEMVLEIGEALLRPIGEGSVGYLEGMSWASDSERLVFSVNRPPFGGTSLYVATLSGEVRRIGEAGGLQGYDPSWQIDSETVYHRCVYSLVSEWVCRVDVMTEEVEGVPGLDSQLEALNLSLNFMWVENFSVNAAGEIVFNVSHVSDARKWYDIYLYDTTTQVLTNLSENVAYNMVRPRWHTVPLVGAPPVADAGAEQTVNAQNEPLLPDIRLYWSPDGSQVAVVFWTEIRLYNAQLTQFTSLPLEFPEDEFTVLAVSWIPAGTHLSVEVRTRFDRYVQIWETKPIQLLSQLHENAITRPSQWSPDGQHFAVVYGSSSIRIYDRNTAALVSEFSPLDFATIQNFAWNPVCNEIVIVIGTSLYFWDVMSNTYRGDLDNVSDGNIAFRPNGNALATVAVSGGSPYADLVIWDVDTLQPIQTLVGHTESIYRFAWANNERLATVSFDRTIRVWDVSTGQTTGIIPVGLVHQIEWYPDDENLYVIDPDNNKVVINVSTGEAVEFELPPLTAHAGPDQTLTADASGFATLTLDGSASFDPDGEIVSYVWTLDGVEIATGVSPTVTLEAGENVITLTVTDNDGATASDTVTITVVAASTPTPTVTITPTDTPTATLTPTPTPTPSQVCDISVAAGDALGLVNAINTANNNVLTEPFLTDGCLQ